jgi:hypothetical protein
MTFHVQCKMIGPGEGVIAYAADVWFVASVLAVVATQFVGSGEFPLTARPRATERLFTCASFLQQTAINQRCWECER